METVTVPSSLCVDGQWQAAHWHAEVVDDASGELLVTAQVAGGLVVALQMTSDLMRDLRRVAGFDGALPGEDARAELAYWRESVQFAVDKLMAPGRELGNNASMALWNAESYLRQLLAFGQASKQAETPAPDGSRVLCYDVEHECNGVRLAKLEQRLDELAADKVPVANGQWMGEIERRLAGLARSIHITDRTTNGAFDEIELRMERLESKLDIMWSTLRERGVPLEAYDATLNT